MQHSLASTLVGLVATLSTCIGWGNTASAAENLLLNGDLAFYAFDSSRTGVAGTYRSGAVPCWNTDAYGDIEVWRSTRALQLRTAFPTDGVVKLRPGKRFSQFMLLSEVALDHGDQVSLAVRGRQTRPESLRAAVQCMRLDNQPGTISNPPDMRVFPKHSRGELVRGPSYIIPRPDKPADPWPEIKRRMTKEEKGKTFHRIERSYGEFHRVIPLPGMVDEEHIEACDKDGVLTVALPKSKEAQPKHIEVKKS